MKAVIFAITLLAACQTSNAPSDAAPPTPDAVVELDAAPAADASIDFCIESCCNIVTGDLSCCPNGETCCPTGPCPGL